VKHRYIGNPFVNATKSVIKTMLKTDIVLVDQVLMKNNTRSGGATCIIGFSGDRIKGAVAINYATTTDNHTAESIAFIGEVTRNIFVQAKKLYEIEGIHINADTQIVVTGNNAQLHFITDLPIISLAFAYLVEDVITAVYVDCLFDHIEEKASET